MIQRSTRAVSRVPAFTLVCVIVSAMKTQLFVLMLMALCLGACTPEQPDPAPTQAASPDPVPLVTPSALPTPAALEQPPAVTRGATKLEFPKLSEKEVELTASLEPLVGKDMQQIGGTEFEEAFAKFTAAEAKRTYKSSDFSGFLPTQPVRVGEVWKISPGVASKFLSQLHPRVQEHMKRDGAGAYGMVRASSETHLELLVRIHAQFWLVDKKLSVTPAQFETRLLIDRRSNSVEYAAFSVPTEYTRNVNFQGQNEGTILVGMVFTPRLELVSGDPRLLTRQLWSERLEKAFARKQLAKQFFTFEQLEWVPLEQAMERAKAEKKAVFAIVLEGVLNDQSC